MCHHASTSNLLTSSSLRDLITEVGKSHLEGASCLDAFRLIPSIHSYPAMPLARQLVHQRYVHPGPLVLRTAPLKFPTPTTDRDRTVSRRSEPGSRTALMGECPTLGTDYAQDAMSRHRGAKPPVDVNSWGDKPVIPG